MKKFTRISTIQGLLLLLLVGAVGSFADYPAKRPGTDDLLGVWVGYDDRYSCFYRLNLQEHGAGRLVILRPGKVVDTYKVDTWGISGPDLTITTVPESQRSERFTCVVELFDFSTLKIRVEGVTNQWERTVWLIKEERLRKDLSEAGQHDRAPSANPSSEPSAPTNSAVVPAD
jgi:hypothetical protein